MHSHNHEVTKLKINCGLRLRILISDENDKKLYEKKAQEQENENEALKKEIKEPASVSSSSINNVQKLKEDNLHKLNVREDQVAMLTNKLGAQSQFSAQKKIIEEPMKQLQYEIQSLKFQKVQLQRKIKQDSMQFRFHKTSMEKEVLQLKKKNEKIQYEMHKLQASTQRSKMVLEQKTKEASFATKRLQELIKSRKTSSHRKSGVRNGKLSDVQGIEQKLDVTEQLHEFCSKYDHQIEEMSEDILKLKEEAHVLREEKLRFSLQEAIATSSATSIRIGSINTWTSDLKHFERPNTSKKTDVALCCSCCTRSLCKTVRCWCRSNKTTCGPTCGCAPSMCCNREEDEGGKGGFHRALLHEGSVVEKPRADTEQFVPRKEFLSDITNTQTNQGF